MISDSDSEVKHFGLFRAECILVNSLRDEAVAAPGLAPWSEASANQSSFRVTKALIVHDISRASKDRQCRRRGNGFRCARRRLVVCHAYRNVFPNRRKRYDFLAIGQGDVPQHITARKSLPLQSKDILREGRKGIVDVTRRTRNPILAGVRERGGVRPGHKSVSIFGPRRPAPPYAIPRDATSARSNPSQVDSLTARLGSCRCFLRGAGR